MSGFFAKAAAASSDSTHLFHLGVGSTKLPWYHMIPILENYMPGYRADILEVNTSIKGEDPCCQVQS